jgi:outer membrane autotransporter protein
VALPALGALYGRLVVDTLHERVGEEEQLKGRTDIGEGRGIWARAIYWGGKRDGSEVGVLGGDGPKFDYDIKALQAGFDIIRDEDDDGTRNFIGFFGATGRVEADVTHFSVIDGGVDINVGRDAIDAYSLGGYWTRFGPKDGYLDAVVMFNWYDVRAKSRRLPELRGNFQSVAVSLEAGKPFHMKHDWLVEPEAQLIYQHGFGSKLADTGGPFRYDDTDSLLGRIGARVAKTWDRADEGEQTRLTTAWARLSLWHEFMDRPSTTFETEDGPVTIVADTGQDWLEVVGALSRQMSRKTTLYGNLGYSWDLDNDGRAWMAKLGVRFNW